VTEAIGVKNGAGAPKKEEDFIAKGKKFKPEYIVVLDGGAL
jgi:hypothetical protein